MDDLFNTIVQGDCIAGMNQLAEGSIDLAFADPPFNIGYDYDVYQDRKQADEYLDWSRRWMTAVYRVLKPDGTFWLAIGDEYAAELKVTAQSIGFHTRSWVIWYYTFGVNCKRKFSRSHAHLFHFVKDREQFTFLSEDPQNRIPSARQLVYNDNRANPVGRLPDDTWIIRPADCLGELADDEGTWSPAAVPPPEDIERTFTLRPQDLRERFSAAEDTWYFPRVAGTFKERAGFHGCQMPEQLLGRIVRYCSREHECVLDPFSGSATTAAVAKKLGRKYIGFELSEEYARRGRERLASICVGDRLDGSEEPTASAPPTHRRKAAFPKSTSLSGLSAAERASEERFDRAQRELTLRGVAEAFRLAHQGFSADRLVCDPELNESFADACQRLGVVGDRRLWNTLLFRLRKAGAFASLPVLHTSAISWEDCDPYLFASEIALQQMLSEDLAGSLDEILCDPRLVAEFDARAALLAPGFTPFEYRWAALKLRKNAKTARSRGAMLLPPAQLGRKVHVGELATGQIPQVSGLYLLADECGENYYIGETLNLAARLRKQFSGDAGRHWQQVSPTLSVQTHVTEIKPARMLAWQSCLIRKYHPQLNFRELCAV